MITQAEVKEYLNLAIDNTNYNTVIDNFILTVKQDLINYLGWNFISHSEDFYFVGNDENVMILPFLQIATVNNLYYAEKPTDTYTQITSNFALFPINGLYKVYYENGFNNDYLYKCNVTAGWSSSAVPKDLWEIARELIAIKFKESNVNSAEPRLGLKQSVQNLMGGSSTMVYANYFEHFNNCKPLLRKYRIIVI